jgi:parallel beta-helix repeat protein
LDYTLIQYGGGDIIKGGIRIYEASPTVEHNIIRYNNHGIYVSKGFPTIRNNDIIGNTDYGVFNYSTTTIDAANNWWGHASEPSGVGPGSGDPISDYVDYTPWLEAPANPSSDTNPPATITDLTASAGSQPGTVNLSWSATGDDSSVGTASAYIVRYANSIINSETAWGSAMDVPGEPTPGEPGSAENMVVSGLNSGTTYYFAVRTQDEIPNLSGLSNSPSASPIGSDPGTTSRLTYLPLILR